MDDDEFSIFDADCPVVAMIKRDRARQAQDAIVQEQAEHDAKAVELIRVALLEKYDLELLEITERTLSKETEAAYAGEFTRFRKWCVPLGVTSLPAAPEVVALYLDEQLDGGTSNSGIKRIHAAISYAHRIAGVADPAPAPHPDDESEPFDPTWRPFPLAVLKRARALAKQKASNGSSNPGG
jgi:hypothetical protein